MFWTTLVSIMLSAGALAGLFLSLRQTSRAIKDARISSELQNQAYAFVSQIEFGERSPLIATCKNTGLTPATHFSIAAKAHIAKRGKVSALAPFENREYKTWTRLGPDEETTVALAVENDELVRRFLDHTLDNDEVLVICGTLLYCTIYNRDHETQFMFYIEGRSANRFRRPTAALKSSEPIPPQKGSDRDFPTPWQKY